MCRGSWIFTMSPPVKISPNPVRRSNNHNNNDAFIRQPGADNPVFADIQTILFILKATGLFPIYKQISSYEVGPPSKSHEFYSIFVRGVLHALTFFNIYYLFLPGSTDLFFTGRDTDNVNQWIEILLALLTYSIMVRICASNAKAYLQVMNDLLKLDEEVRRQFGVVLSNASGFTVKFLLGLSVGQAYNFVLTIVDMPVGLTPTSYILIVGYALQNSLSTTFIVFASAFMHIISIRFDYLNRILNGYTYIAQQRKYQRRRLAGGIQEIPAALMQNFPEDSLFVYRLHNQLLRIYKAINDCCSLILVSYMGYAFYTITTYTYNLFVQITNKDKASANILQMCCAWLLTHTALLALLSYSCGHATKQANITSQILARVYDKSKELQNIIDKFLTKSIKQEVQFTAYGFFVIDISTLFKIFSAVTTYLVILIQFKQLEDFKLGDQQAQPNT